MENEAPNLLAAAIVFLVVVMIVSSVGVVGAIYLGTETKADDDEEWQRFLTEHPDAIELLEADRDQRVARALHDHTDVPPPVPH